MVRRPILRPWPTATFNSLRAACPTRGGSGAKRMEIGCITRGGPWRRGRGKPDKCPRMKRANYSGFGDKLQVSVGPGDCRLLREFGSLTGWGAEEMVGFFRKPVGEPGDWLLSRKSRRSMCSATKNACGFPDAVIYCRNSSGTPRNISPLDEIRPIPLLDHLNSPATDAAPTNEPSLFPPGRSSDKEPP